MVARIVFTLGAGGIVDRFSAAVATTVIGSLMATRLWARG